MALPVSFRWDEGFVARVDAARGDVPRSVFVRRAVERALETKASRSDVPETSSLDPHAGSIAAPAPAEQPLSRAEAFRRLGQK